MEETWRHTFFFRSFCGRPQPPWRGKLSRWFLQSKKQHHHHGVVLQWRSGHGCTAKPCWSPQQRRRNGLHHGPPRRWPEPLRRVVRRAKVHLSEGPQQSPCTSDHGDDCSHSSWSDDAATVVDARPSMTEAAARSSSSPSALQQQQQQNSFDCAALRVVLENVGGHPAEEEHRLTSLQVG